MMKKMILGVFSGFGGGAARRVPLHGLSRKLNAALTASRTLPGFENVKKIMVISPLLVSWRLDTAKPDIGQARVRTGFHSCAGSIASTVVLVTQMET
jgi:hypothetical protein